MAFHGNTSALMRSKLLAVASLTVAALGVHFATADTTAHAQSETWRSATEKRVLRSPSAERYANEPIQSQPLEPVTPNAVTPDYGRSNNLADPYDPGYQQKRNQPQYGQYDQRRRDVYRPQPSRQTQSRYPQRDDYRPVRPPYAERSYEADPKYRSGPAYRESYRGRDYKPGPAYREPYPPRRAGRPYAGPPVAARPPEATYTSGEILNAGHRFFGKVTKGLASVVEYAFKRSGRPSGYILGEEGGGAFVAGLRYGEGTLYTKNFGTRKIYWQGPSIGYDFGAEGSKTLILIYNTDYPEDVLGRHGGIDGSAYLVGGVGITYLQKGHVVTAPIRSGVGLRLGANIGYLKFTKSPTWNPF